MSELSISNCQFSTLLISNFIRLCSFILSHPLYFSYFLFFSPYLLKLISFLSPLFITTFLVFLAFLAGFVHTESSQTRFASVLERLQFKKDCPNEELHLSDDLGIYETVFGSSPTVAVTETDPPSSEFSDSSVVKSEEGLGETKVCTKPENPCVVMEEKRLENFFKILDEFERLASNVEEMKKKLEPPSRGAKSDKVVEKQKSLLMNGSEAASDDNNNNTNIKAANDASAAAKLNECSSPMAAKSQSQRIISSAAADHQEQDVDGDDGKLKARAESCRALDAGNLSSYGSMRREREWERTLACKLFEERQNVGGGEGMDSLWEAYEMEEFGKVGRRKKERERVKREKKIVEREWEGEDEEIGGQLCCLQALKLSAGKVILGVGKPNLVKISKAIKGIGWLHKTTKNSKKVHNHGDHTYS